MNAKFYQFISKVCNLIITSRKVEFTLNKLPQKKSDPQSPLTNSHFQLSFEEPYNIRDSFETGWLNSEYQDFVIEFFFQQRDDKNKNFLIEQWSFNISKQQTKLPQNSKESEKKMAILMRNISSMLVMLPLFKDFLKENNSKYTKEIRNNFVISLKLNYSTKTLSKWNTFDNVNRVSFEDIYIGNSKFSIQVMSKTSFGFVVKDLYENSGANHSIISKNIPPPQRGRFLSDDNIDQKSTSETQNESPPPVYYFNNLTAESSSPQDSFYGTTPPFQTYKTIFNKKYESNSFHKKSTSSEFVQKRKLSGTLENEAFVLFDEQNNKIFNQQDPDNISSRDINSIQEDINDHEDNIFGAFMKLGVESSKKIDEKNKVLHTMLFEENEDDLIAELLKKIETLKKKFQTFSNPNVSSVNNQSINNLMILPKNSPSKIIEKNSIMVQLTQDRKEIDFDNDFLEIKKLYEEMKKV